MSVRVRFAPSPTGIPHIGNTRTALYNYLFAKKHHGQFVLRIEDTDRERLVPGSLDKILEILQFVGISWDEGPFIQSERLELYQQHAVKLVDSGHAYYCFCTKDRLEQLRLTAPRYDRLCLKLSPADIATKLKDGHPHVIRLKVPDTGAVSWTDLIQGDIKFDFKDLDDQVLLKSDGYPTYHLGVVVDDHLMNITHVLRGSEWISSTPKHLLLYQSFGWTPPQIGHFPIILGPDKAKLSKRHGATSALDYRDEGYLPQALISFMAYLGWSYQDNSQVLTLDELIDKFDLAHIQKGNAIFDIKKLDYFNGKAIRAMADQELLKVLHPFIPTGCSPSLAKAILPLVKDRLVKLSDFSKLTAFFYTDITLDTDMLIQQSLKPKSEIKATLDLLIQTYAAVADKDWHPDNLETIGKELINKTGWTPKQLFMTLRVATTGTTVTPPLFETLAVLPPQTTLSRLRHAQRSLL